MLHLSNVKYIVNNIFGTNLLQSFSSILTCKVERGINNYNKNKNKWLIMLGMKFEKISS